MANTLKPKRSYTASATPTLAAGELAIQAADKKVLIGNSTGTGNILIASLNGSDITGTVASATSATTATNLAGGGAGQIHYQSANNTTSMLAAGTSGQLLRSNGSSAPSWETQGLFSSGRLTLESGVPVSTTDQTAKTTIFFTPYNGDKISLYDGSSWATYTFTERSLLLSGLTANRNYDVFLYVSSGTLNLESLVWNSSSDSNTRTTGLVLTSGGVYTKSGDATRRYLGTFRTTGTTGQTEDSVTKRFVFNANNQISKNVRKVDTTGSWTYQATAYRYANNSSLNKVEVVCGLSSFINLTATVFFHAGANLQGARTAIGEDSSTSPASECIITDGASIPNYYVGTNAYLSKMPTAGYHYYSWLESTFTVYVMTFYGADSDYRRTGLIGYFIC